MGEEYGVYLQGKANIDVYHAVAPKYHVSGEAAAHGLSKLSCSRDGENLHGYRSPLQANTNIGKNKYAELSRRNPHSDMISHVGWIEVQ
jgi:hypothetical protein